LEKLITEDEKYLFFANYYYYYDDDDEGPFSKIRVSVYNRFTMYVHASSPSPPPSLTESQ